jgi:micrococcal nuclease
LVFACDSPATLSAVDFTGKVVGISDGNTIKILVGRTPLKVRLYGIDSPECGQAYGKRAKQLAGQLAFRQDVPLEKRTRRWYAVV